MESVYLIRGGSYKVNASCLLFSTRRCRVGICFEVLAFLDGKYVQGNAPIHMEVIAARVELAWAQTASGDYRSALKTITGTHRSVI